jgi:hypothetical protein
MEGQQIPRFWDLYVKYEFSADGKSYSLAFGNTPAELLPFSPQNSQGFTYGKEGIPIFQSPDGTWLSEPIKPGDALSNTGTYVDANNKGNGLVDTLEGYQQTGFRFKAVGGDLAGELEWVRCAPLLEISAGVMPALRHFWTEEIWSGILASAEHFPWAFVIDPLTYLSKTYAADHPNVVSGANIEGEYVLDANGSRIHAPAKLLSVSLTTEDPADFTVIGPVSS